MTIAPLRKMTDAYAHKEAGSHGLAFELFCRCLENDQTIAVASFEVAQYFENGLAVSKNFARAFDHYMVAAHKNIADAQEKVAVYLAAGDHVGQDLSQSQMWFEKAKSQREKDSLDAKASPKTLADSIREEMLFVT